MIMMVRCLSSIKGYLMIDCFNASSKEHVSISLLPIGNLTWHNLLKEHPELVSDGLTCVKT